MRPKWPRLLPVYLVIAVVAAAFGLLPLEETAAVRVAAPVQTLKTNMLIDLPARHIDAEITDSQLGNTTVTPRPAQYASGQVKFTYKCDPTIKCQPGQFVGVPAGAVVATAKNVRYATQTEARFVGPDYTANAPVKAITPGAAANTGSHTITIIEGYPDPGLFTVDNQYPVTGGADPTVTQVIQQSDIDAVQRDLTSRIADRLRATLMGEASGMDFVVDGPPSFKVQMVDHVVGDSAPTFTMRIAGKLGAVAFSESSAQALVRSALQPIVLPGYRLTSEPIETSYQITQPITNGSVAVRVAAGTVAVPTLSTQHLSARLKGLSISDARKELQRQFPGSHADIRLQPAPFPFMPAIADHISPTLTIEPANGIYREYTLTGIVPDGMITALIQINLEGWAGGRGPIDVDLYQLTYFQADEARQRIPNGNFEQGFTYWGNSDEAAGMVSLRPSDRGGQLLHMRADRPIRRGWVNSPHFTVTAGATYTVTFAARVSPKSRASGEFALVWGTGGEQWVSSRKIPFAPAW